MIDGWPELAGVRLIEEERIREQEFGYRLLFSDWRFFFALHPEQQQLLRLQGFYWYRYPQGENVADVRARNRSWMSTLTRDFAAKRVLAITHHLNILSFRANMERLSSQQFIELDAHSQPANCSITSYVGQPEQGQDGRFQLAQYDLCPD
jgi:broad specificity phosphatase PhoE